MKTILEKRKIMNILFIVVLITQCNKNLYFETDKIFKFKINLKSISGNTLYLVYYCSTVNANRINKLFMLL